MKEAAAPWVEIFAQGLAIARAKGVSEAEIEAALEWFERDNADRLNPDVLQVTLGELRKAAGLK
jgi:hypothetical protein